MKCKEVLSKIKSELTFRTTWLDADAAHMQGFPAHRAGCSRTQPLEIQLNVPPGAGGASWSGLIQGSTMTTSCTECHGNITQ